MSIIPVNLVSDFLSVLRDVAPVAVVVLFFQLLVLRRPLPNPKSIFSGFLAVIVGLYLFLIGLDIGIFPLGEEMAKRFSHPDTQSLAVIFAFCMGYSATIAEPALLAIATKAEDISAGGLRSFALRNAVALGVAVGLTLGVYRIITGGTLWIFILSGYVVAIFLTFFAPKEIIPLAYDSGGVTTSTITVPLVTALGLGLAQNIPGRNPMMDGFGLIAFASVFPIISVLGYAVFIRWMNTNPKIRR